MALWRPVVSLFGAWTRPRTRGGVTKIIKPGCPWLTKSRWNKIKNKNFEVTGKRVNSIPKRKEEVSVYTSKEKKTTVFYVATPTVY